MWPFDLACGSDTDPSQEPPTDDAARTIRLLNAAADGLRNQLAEQAKQITFLQTQYTAASSYVDTVRKDNAKLTETNATLQTQVTSGMALIRSTYEGRVKFLEQNATRWQETAQFVMKKDELTNDDVRKKASLLAVREAEMQNMRAEMVGWRGRAEGAERRCRELEGG
ncbi:hypothetical protein BDZ89DRAFT_939388 [Hymenopellis radicata]|nr:hypothetical protein BDZ89DRAFT_939388 [Hymenopellis radicata]